MYNKKYRNVTIMTQPKILPHIGAVWRIAERQFNFIYLLLSLTFSTLGLRKSVTLFTFVNCDILVKCRPNLPILGRNITREIGNEQYHKTSE